ncbi:hypothetical protein [Thalassoporum mexicanum]|uniref:hypothetical protein n=1 Tax=Thalassoporum mexicanum TaxID=3457544 RepID=UPI0005A01931|nr:hypothetical protein [Pseudanabaena sp. PCC 7367]
MLKRLLVVATAVAAAPFSGAAIAQTPWVEVYTNPQASISVGMAQKVQGTSALVDFSVGHQKLNGEMTDGAVSVIMAVTGSCQTREYAITSAEAFDAQGNSIPDTYVRYNSPQVRQASPQSVSYMALKQACESTSQSFQQASFDQ